MDFNRRLPTGDIILIERENDYGDRDMTHMYDFSSFDYFTYIAIGFVYAFLVSLIVSRILNYDRVEKECDMKNMTIDNPQRTAHVETCRKAMNDFDSKKFFYMIIIGVLSILGGAYMAKVDHRYMTGGLGIALGGLMTIIYFTLYNWSSLGKDFQLILLGLTFVLLFYGSTHF